MCDHAWQVYSTAVGTGCLMVECRRCGAIGTVPDPLKAEWRRAFRAPSAPYRWDGGDERIVLAPAFAAGGGDAGPATEGEN
jgi:hypothetical protein